VKEFLSGRKKNQIIIREGQELRDIFLSPCCWSYRKYAPPQLILEDQEGLVSAGVYNFLFDLHPQLLNYFEQFGRPLSPTCKYIPFSTYYVQANFMFIF